MRSYYIEWQPDFKEIMEWLDESEQWDTIYINSWWWESFVFATLLARLNREKKVVLRALFIASRWFELFDKYEWEKYIEEWCDWVVHIEWTQKLLNWKVIRWDDIEKERHKHFKNRFKYNFLTKEEKKKFDNWYDVYISYKRLLKIYKK